MKPKYFCADKLFTSVFYAPYRDIYEENEMKIPPHLCVGDCPLIAAPSNLSFTP